MKSDKSAKILIVEDDMIIAADLSMQLTKIGYDIIGINTKAEDALKTISDHRPDIIIMDIVLSGKMNGIEAAVNILHEYQIPVIFMTSNTDDATFQKALSAKPYAFIAKPFQKSELERTIKLSLQRAVLENETRNNHNDTHYLTAMEDRLFIRHRGEMVKVALKDINYLEADRNYCKIYTSESKYMVSVPLRNIEAQLPDSQFVRVHRSYVVNLHQIDAISEYQEYLTLGTQQIPISRRMKEQVIKRLKMI